jgi:hypothetical protein
VMKFMNRCLPSRVSKSGDETKSGAEISAKK